MALWLALLLWAMSSAARAQGSDPAAPVELPQLLTLADALQLLRTRGLDLLIAEAAVKKAEGDVQTAAAIYNPNVSVSAGPGFNYSAAPPCSGCSDLTINWALSDNGALFDFLVGKRKLRMRTAAAARAAAKLARADAQRKLQYQVKQQYLQIVTDVAVLELTRQIQASMNQTLELSRKRYLKVISEADLARVEVQKLEADQAVAQASMNLRQDQVALALLLGVRGTVPDFAVEKALLSFQVPPALQQSSENELLGRALMARPDVQGAEQQRQRAAAALQLARRLQVPDVPLNVQFNMMGSGQKAAGPPYVAPGLAVNLPIFYQQQGEIRRAQADVKTQLLQQAKTAAQVAAELGKAYAAWVTARRQVERMQGRILERAQTARDILQKQYLAGSATLIDFLDAQRTYLATNLEYLSDLTAYWTAVFAVEAALAVELWP